MESIEIKEQKRALKKIFTAVNIKIKDFDKELKKRLEINLNKLVSLESKIESTLEKIKKNYSLLLKRETSLKKSLTAQAEKFESIEETFYILYHNIKKNQFLYADDKDEWWKDYLDLKKKYIEENKKSA